MNIVAYTLIFTSLLTCKSETANTEINSNDIASSTTDTVLVEQKSAQEVVALDESTTPNVTQSPVEPEKEAAMKVAPEKKVVETEAKENNPIKAQVNEDNSLEETVEAVAGKTAVPDSNTEIKEEKEIIAGVDHTPWNDLLKKYVDDAGNVNYKAFKNNIKPLDAYLKTLADNPPSSSWSKNEKLAYYINLYNAATVKLIVDNYPTKSIKDIPNRWKKKWIIVGNTITSLNDIEHEVLRKMDEPRIHFAINCASYSCPKLLNAAFTSQNMERLLSKTAVDFVNDTKRNRFQKGKAQLSRIFKWYKSDFTKRSSLLEYINVYLDNPINKKASISYLDYDWSLNEAK